VAERASRAEAAVAEAAEAAEAEAANLTQVQAEGEAGREREAALLARVAQESNPNPITPIITPYPNPLP